VNCKTIRVGPPTRHSTPALAPDAAVPLPR